MSDRFVRLADGFYVSPQISETDIAEAKALGIGLIISNRPDDEEPGQPANAALAAAAEAANVRYVEIPVDKRGIGRYHIDTLKETLHTHDGPVLAFCRSGTRSTMLRAYVRASEGDNINTLLKEAADAGYDLYTIMPGLEAVAPRRRRADLLKK